MTNDINQQKQQIKEKMNKALDEHYKSFAEAGKQKKLTIDEIERLWGESIKKTQDILKESTEKIVKGRETEGEGEKKCPKCGKRLKNHSQRTKFIKTLHGELSISRNYYYCRRCHYSETSQDQELGTEGLAHSITKALRSEIVFYGQNQPSFKEAGKMIKRALGMEISKETVRQVTEKTGTQVFTQDSQRAEGVLSNIHNMEILNKKNQKEKTLYIMIDGAAVNTRIEDENGSTWRENKTVIVFTDKDIIKRKKSSNIIVKKEYVPYIGNAEGFRKYVLDAAVRAGYGKIKRVVIIADGATWIRNLCHELFPDGTQILDIYHLKENIYTYAKHKYNQNPAEYTPWAEEFISKIENGKVEEALAQIPKEEKLPAGVVNLRTYIENNKNKINYTEYKKQGFYIGSGAIESGNKVILHRRLKQPGMRWSIGGAQALLTLRAKYESNLWGDVINVIQMAS